MDLWADFGIVLAQEAQGHLVSINPSTGQPIGAIKLSDSTECEKIVSEACQAFERWSTVPAPKRGELVRQIGEHLRHKKAALGQLIACEMGKSLQEAEGEVQEMIDMADFAVGQSRMLYGITTHSERAQHRLYEQWHPLGVVGVITAFNFPVAVWAWNAFLAIIAGNSVIWKPSSKTPLCALAVQNICQTVMQANGIEGLLSVMLPASRDNLQAFLDDQRIALISFTGSCHTGQHVNETVAKRFGRVILELGGNNAIIVDESADLDVAIPAIVYSALGTSGQRCTSVRRLFLHEKHYEKIVWRLKKIYEKITIGDPLDPTHWMGPLIDQAAVEKYSQVIQTIRSLGGEIVYGGEILPRAGYFVQPTLVKAAPQWAIIKEETFAPILYMFPFHTLEEAVRMQNDVVQGLSSALFTRSLQASEYFLSVRGSDCGIANINVGTSGAEIGGAFGGEKQTGGGREAGSDAWRAYMRRQTNTINWGETLPLSQGITFISED